jgi:hypothetical protein
MNWYYTLENQQKGPIHQSEFERLGRAGVITNTTLVWREGMANWQGYSEIAVPPNAPLPIRANSGGIICSQCGQVFALDQVVKLGGAYVCAGCKPIAVQKLQEGVVSSQAEETRKDHIKHEASIKSVGFLYFFGAAFLLLASIPTFIPSSRARGSIFAFLFLGLAALQLWAGVGLRRLRPWARIPSGLLSGFGLLAFPLGTLINGYILYLLFSKKGTTIFSDEYRRVIQETPHIKYRTSLLIWILLGLLLLLLGGMLVAGFFAARH